MAYFQRADERDQLIVCNICDCQPISERRVTAHKTKCQTQYSDKFKSGKLLVCKYDKGHIVEAGKMDLHLEFCTKYQNTCLAEFQEEEAQQNKLINNQPATTNEITNRIQTTALTPNDWGIMASEEPYIHKFANLKLSNK